MTELSVAVRYSPGKDSLACFNVVLFYLDADSGQRCRPCFVE